MIILITFQSVSFTNAAFEVFAEAYLCFLVSASAKKNTELIKFLGILKNLVQERKVMFHLIKKLFLTLTQHSNLIL